MNRSSLRSKATRYGCVASEFRLVTDTQQVAPAELEAQLLENKAIADAAVIGVTM